MKKLRLDADPGLWSFITFAIFIYLVVSLGLLAPSLNQLMGWAK